MSETAQRPDDTLTVAVGQMAADVDWEANLATCKSLINDAHERGADLLVLPEGILFRSLDGTNRIREAAQPLDGPFVEGLRSATRSLDLTVVAGIHERCDDDERPYNTLVVLRDGELLAAYRKLHLYDAFALRESDNVRPGDEIPPLVDVRGFQMGLMTCYDVRFGEFAQVLASNGADFLVLPAAWVKGPLKEHHWRTLVTARALDSTVYMVASGECGPNNVGLSLVVDPLGVAQAGLGEEPGLLVTEISRQRLTAARAKLPVQTHHRLRIDPHPQPFP